MAEKRNVDLLNLPLATIDMTEALENPEKIAPKVVKAMENEGFLYLRNIPGFKPDELLQWTKWFFNLPLETKMAISKKCFKEDNLNSFRGYFPVIPGGHSHKEAFETGSFGDFDPVKQQNQKLINGRPLMRDVTSEGNSWPNTGTSDDEIYRKVMEYNYDIYRKTASQVLQLIARGMGLDPNCFDYMFNPSPLATLRLIHYPSRVNFPPEEIPDEARDGDTLITTGEHADTTFITLLATFENWGLQMLQNDTWVDVPPIRDGLVMNIGALMTDLFGGRLKSTMHRVIDLGEDRYSVPFFYEPQFDTDISKTFDGKEIESIGRYHRYGPWMCNRTSQFKEYATTDFGVLD
ncbi:unnamed protein product [Owenia fusiformis]|uniref:Uncharacterized protein n=1 Tax=Owenia fusiformis TaxID=6347 RepID=A0A8J1UC95_OWEFU|nr:unnamed protein product [Owenia fusiformis]